MRICEFLDQFQLSFRNFRSISTFFFRFVEKSLEQSLRFRLCHPIDGHIETCRRESLSKISQILPESKRDILTALMDMPRHSEIVFDLNLSTNLSQFRPDVEFRFSMSPNQVFSFVKVLAGKFKCWLNKEEETLIDEQCSKGKIE